MFLACISADQCIHYMNHGYLVHSVYIRSSNLGHRKFAGHMRFKLPLIWILGSYICRIHRVPMIYILHNHCHHTVLVAICMHISKCARSCPLVFRRCPSTSWFIISSQQSLLETFSCAETHLEDNALGVFSCLSVKELPEEAHTVTGDCLYCVAPSSPALQSAKSLSDVTWLTVYISSGSCTSSRDVLLKRHRIYFEGDR